MPEIVAFKDAASTAVMYYRAWETNPAGRNGGQERIRVFLVEVGTGRLR